MNKKHHIILYTLLGLTVLTAAAFGADGLLRASRAQQALEDTYIRHVLETQEQLQAISTQLAKLQVAQDARMRVEMLSAVSRQADGVVGGLTALPLSHAAMSDTIKFCNQLSEYSLGLALLAASGDEMAAEDLKKLHELKNHCTLLMGQLAVAQQQMTELSASGSVFYEAASADARPLEQVADPDNGMEYPSMIYDGAFSDARRTGAPRGLNVTQVDQQMAVEIARSFIGEERVQTAVPGVSAGGILPSHGVTLTLRDGLVLNAEVTRQGGQMLWIMPENAAFSASLTLEECTQAAQAFLQKHGYGAMEAGHYQVYDGMAVIDFIAVQDGVLLYPDQLKLQIRMDTGEVVGLEANQYLMNHTHRTGLQPKLTQEDALNAVSEQLAVSGVRLCVIPQGDAERLCYEITGTYQQQTYMVYIDAMTGEEANVLMVVDGAEGALTA